MKLSQLTKKEQKAIRKSWSAKKKAHIDTSKFVMQTAWSIANDYAKKLNAQASEFFIWALREVWKNVQQPALF